MPIGGNRLANKTTPSLRLPNQVFGQPIQFWICLIRGIFAILLGLILLLQPEKTLPWLANFMGAYWLTSGVISLRFGSSGRRSSRMAILAGIIGILAGVITLARKLFQSQVATEFVLFLLGIIILLTGMLHALGGFRKRADMEREWTWTSFLLGIFEFILGLTLIITPLENGPVVYYSASTWALLGGFILIGDAIYARRQHALHTKMTNP